MRALLAAALTVLVMGCMHMTDGNAQTSAASVPDTMARAMRADAARRAGVDETDVRIESVQSVTWRDASLGCAQPDRLYAQVLGPDWRLRLQAGSRGFDDHTSVSAA
jgi:TnpA family transposase